MSDDKILVQKVIPKADGTIGIIGNKASTDEDFILTCNAHDWCVATLRAENNQKLPKAIELFRLSDIPNVMKIKKWPYAAFINNKWLSEPAVEMTSEEKGKWEKSNPALDYYEPHMFNHEWLSKFERYRKALTALKENIINDNTKPIIIKKLQDSGILKKDMFFNRQTYELSSSYPTIVKASDMKEFHKNWQFQHVKIDSNITSQATTYMAKGIDDLWATFGSCAVYAGIGDYRISKFYGIEQYEIEIKSIICYVVDSYDFIVTEKDDDYLGHWNKTSFDFHTPFSIRNQIYDKAEKLPHKGLTQVKVNYEELLYPVFNHHYQAYRKKMGKGRDMVIWTKPYKIVLNEAEGYKTTFNYSNNGKPKSFLESLVY